AQRAVLPIGDEPARTFKHRDKGAKIERLEPAFDDEIGPPARDLGIGETVAAEHRELDGLAYPLISRRVARVREHVGRRGVDYGFGEVFTRARLDGLAVEKRRAALDAGPALSQRRMVDDPEDRLSFVKKGDE